MFHQPPEFIVFHLGGNDITSVESKPLREGIKQDIAYIAGVYPLAHLVWLDILPRLTWRGARGDSPDRFLDYKRKRANRAGREAVCSTGRGSIIATNIDRSTPGFYSSDGVHLSVVGENMLLFTIREALEAFIVNPHRTRYTEN